MVKKIKDQRSKIKDQISKMQNSKLKDEKKLDKKESENKIQEETKQENKEVEELKQRLEEFENKYKRALADYQNLEKRVFEERKQWIVQANRELLLRLLPVLDTLMLASKHAKDQGLQMSIQQFLDVLKSEGVVRIETEGHEFKPQTMACVTTGEGEEGKVLEEIRAGYMLHDTVLRPAQVVVGKSATS